MPIISVKECLAFGWSSFKSRPWFFVQILIILLALSISMNIVEEIIAPLLTPIGNKSLSFALSLVLNAFTTAGTMVLYLRAHDDVLAAKLANLWQPKLFWRVLGLILVGGALIILGLILFIVPGIIVAIAISFSGYLLIEKKTGVIAAIKESARITKGYRWQLFLLSLVLCGVNLLGALLLLVGLFVTIPVTTLASVHAYRSIQSRQSIADTVVKMTVAGK